MRQLATLACATSAAILLTTAAFAQTPAPAAHAGPLPYGMSISVDQAKKIASGAIAEAKKNNWYMAIAIVDTSGQLVYFEKMDNTQSGSVNVSLGKARSAAMFRRPTSAFFEGLKAGNTYLLALEGANPVPGGFPIVMDGKIVGGIGASGGTGAQDSQVVEAGLKTK